MEDGGWRAGYSRLGEGKRPFYENPVINTECSRIYFSLLFAIGYIVYVISSSTFGLISNSSLQKGVNQFW